MNEKKIYFLLYISSFVIFILSTLSHFLYKWTNFNTFVGFFSPTNESIFQHLKMFVFPTIIYYLFTYLLFNKKYEINLRKWLFFPIVTILVTSFIIMSFYYVSNYGLKIKSMVLDILSLFVGLFISSVICVRIYKYNTLRLIPKSLSVIMIALLLFTFMYFDNNPVEVNLFYDESNHTYYDVRK